MKKSISRVLRCGVFMLGRLIVAGLKVAARLEKGEGSRHRGEGKGPCRGGGGGGKDSPVQIKEKGQLRGFSSKVKKGRGEGKGEKISENADTKED